MKKRYIALLALASIGVFALGGCSNEATVSGNSTTVTGTTVETTTTNMEAYEKFEYESTNKGIAITGLKDNSLTSITIPDDVYSISDNAFKDNDTLETITFNDSLKEIGEHAFDSCSALKSLDNSTFFKPLQASNILTPNFGYLLNLTSDILEHSLNE